MNPDRYALTFACYNQVDYTRLCIDSMLKHGLDTRRLVVVDNGSTDETREYLSGLALGGLFFNTANLGCGVAWNQGALALQAEWTIIMNNDVLVSHQWIESLIEAAEKHQLKIVSPAMIEGDGDYDFEVFSGEASEKMRDVIRIGDAHAVCLAVHHSVWMDIGYFQPVPKLLGYEDTLFFNAAKNAGIRMGITGASWLHHFGSITQKAMKQERGLAETEGLGYRHNYRLLHQNWLERKLKKIQRKQQEKRWREDELKHFGMTIHGGRSAGVFHWV